MRLFISFNFDEQTINNISLVQSRLKACASGKFVPAQNMHLTLAFLGEVKPSRVRLIKQAMRTVSVPKMTLTFDHTGAFTRGDIWWIGLRQNKSLLHLQSSLSDALTDFGFIFDSRPFRPHITIARKVKPHTQITQADLLPEPFSTHAEAISLMHSHRIDGKLTYTQIYSV